MPRLHYDPANDYYALLGLTPRATPAQVQRAFHRLAKEVHPDRNPEDQGRATARFQALNEAYHVLDDPDLRREYDRLRWPHLRFEPEAASGEAWAGYQRTASEGSGSYSGPHSGDAQRHAQRHAHRRRMVPPGALGIQQLGAQLAPAARPDPPDEPRRAEPAGPAARAVRLGLPPADRDDPVHAPDLPGDHRLGRTGPDLAAPIRPDRRSGHLHRAGRDHHRPTRRGARPDSLRGAGQRLTARSGRIPPGAGPARRARLPGGTPTWRRLGPRSSFRRGCCSRRPLTPRSRRASWRPTSIWRAARRGCTCCASA